MGEPAAPPPPGPPPPGWRDLVAGARELTGLAWRAAPVATVGSLALQPAAAALTVLSGLWLKVIADAVVAQDRAAALRGALAIAGSLGLSRATMALGLRLVISLGERTGFAMEECLGRAMAAVDTLEVFEQPEHLDRLDLLREQREFYAFTLNALAQGLREVTRLVATLVLLATVDTRLLLLALVGAPSLLGAIRARLSDDDTQVELAGRRRLATHLLELATTAGPGSELRVFGLAGEIERRWEAVSAEADERSVAQEWRASRRSLVAWLPFGGGFIAAVALVVTSAVDGGASTGDVVLVVTVAGALAGNLNSVAVWTSQVAAALRFLARYVQVTRFAVDRAAQAVAVATVKGVPTLLERGISLRDVSFTYPGTGTTVLHHIDLDLPAGSTVALVGENGAGKTSLVKLLCRLYEPTTGHLEADGRRLSDMAVADWRSVISAGFQDFARFELIARESVGVGDLSVMADAEAVHRALQTAGAEGVVGRLDAGLDTLLGRTWGGTDLSTGQWQQLALGRAMMRRRPLLLVLDEPTASLDAEAEHRLFDLYARQSRRRAADGAITVIVSHRFSTVRAADLIVVLDGGRVIETGSHSQLMAAGGGYAELFAVHARAYRR
ncbi:MAG: ABC transporter ATP-binding protein [Acidimicrobiales bacterium]